MELQILSEIVLIFAIAIFVILVCHRLSVPPIIGFLFTGALTGPYGIGLIKASHEVESLAEIGIVLLLFTIGIEFSLKNLLKIKKTVLIGGMVQVALTTIGGALIALQFGANIGQAVFVGFLVSLSSTAIVLKLFQEKAEIDSPHGRTGLAILIFQDIIIVPMILLTPLLAGVSEQMNYSVFALVLKGIGVIILVLVSAQWIVPKLLFHIAKTQSRELFLLSIITICFAVAWLTSSIGLSLALGAFLAGLIISESEYSHQALGNILPFKDIFTSFFFISIGMLLNVSYLFANPALVIALALVVIVFKAAIASAAALALGFPLRTIILVGLSLSQVGEFSFILSKSGVTYGLLTGESYQLFLAVSVITMALTPFVIGRAPQIADLSLKLPWPQKLKTGLRPIESFESSKLSNHLVIIGYGVNGRNVSRAAKMGGIPYLIMEMNPELVRAAKNDNEPIYFGDATQAAVLEHANISEAKVIVIAVSDPAASRAITNNSRKINPEACIIVRTRYLQELKPLYDEGASEVIPEEFETSVEIFTRVLRKYLIPRDEIDSFIHKVRSDSYDMFTKLSLESASTPFTNLNFNLPNAETETYRLRKDCILDGEILANVNLRKNHGITLLAIIRGSDIITNPYGDIELKADDILVVFGDSDSIASARNVFNQQPA